MARVKDNLDYTRNKFDVIFEEGRFRGECTKEEIKRLQSIAKDKKCSCIVGLGGGKAIDTAKCVAKGDNLIVVPTIVATDAPTSHSAVVYTENGAFSEYLYFKQNPSVVLVDTGIIAKAPVRFLVAGIGDALSTYFEARASFSSYSDVNAGLACGAFSRACVGAKATNLSFAIAKLCYNILLQDGINAKISCEQNVTTASLENIIEANTLLSGLGFESCGLACAHAVHNGFTAIAETHSYLHGEKVAFGTIVQLVLENADKKELYKIIQFCEEIGLPICLADIGIVDATDSVIWEISKKACNVDESIHFMPFDVSENDLFSAIKLANAIGVDYKNKG